MLQRRILVARGTGHMMYYQSNHPLSNERRQRRLAEAQRCIAVAIGAQSQALAVAMIDEAIHLVALERCPPTRSPIDGYT